MNDRVGASENAAPGKFYPVVLGFFVGSGFAALVYEIVWFQLLELVIGSTAISLAGLLAVVVLYLLPAAANLYAGIGAQGAAGIAVRALLCAAFLLPPTVLMGATLPCAARFIERTPRGVSWLGILYTGNLAGAVVGCLVAGFHLLRLYDMASATFVAVAVNALCAALALLVAALAPDRGSRAPAGAAPLALRSEAA